MIRFTVKCKRNCFYYILFWHISTDIAKNLLKTGFKLFNFIEALTKLRGICGKNISYRR